MEAGGQDGPAADVEWEVLLEGERGKCKVERVDGVAIIDYDRTIVRGEDRKHLEVGEEYNTTQSGGTVSLVEGPACSISREGIEGRVSTITCRMLAMINTLYPSIALEEDRVAEVLRASLKVSDLLFGAADAAAWAQNFEWDPSVHTRDLMRYEKNNRSVTHLVREIQDRYRDSRLNPRRVQKWVPLADPDYERIMQLAKEGMRLLVDEEFSPNGRPPPMRELYKQVAKAVNSLVQDLWKDDLVIIMPTKTIRRLPGVHFSAAHWAPKAGKRCGRGIFDSSDSKHGRSLNSESARCQLEDLYGSINHPTLSDLVHMILQLADAEGWENIVLWKGDLARAFTLLNFQPHQVALLACELTDGLTMMYHSGLFGWVGTPYAFQVCTRVLERLIQSRITGHCRLYVDDVMGVSTARALAEDRQKAGECMTGLLGPHAVAEDKWEEGRQLDFIGWTIDLDRRLVTLRQRNFLKTLYGFLNVDENAPVSLEDMQRLSSWASRYSEVIRVMRPYTSYLYAETAGRSNRRATRKLRPETKEVIRLWRMVLILTHLHADTFTRSLVSFRLEAPEIEIRFDASLQGVGLSLWSVSSHQVLTAVATTFPFSLGQDSSHQNLAEFCAVVLAVAVLASKGYRDLTLSLVGDSVSALTWGQSEHFRGQLNTRAAAVFIAICAEFGYWVATVKHIAGEDNDLHDKLSRGTPPEDLGFNSDQILDLKLYPQVRRLLSLCCPGSHHADHWVAVREAVEELKSNTHVLGFK